MSIQPTKKITVHSSKWYLRWLVTLPLRPVIIPPLTKAKSTIQNSTNNENNTTAPTAETLKKVTTTPNSVINTGKKGSLNHRNIVQTEEKTPNVTKSRVPSDSYSFEYSQNIAADNRVCTTK